MPEIGTYYTQRDSSDSTLSNTYVRVDTQLERSGSGIPDNHELVNFHSVHNNSNDAAEMNVQYTLNTNNANHGDVHAAHEPRRTGTNNGHQAFGMWKFNVGASPQDSELRHREAGSAATATVYMNRAYVLELDVTHLIDGQDYVWVDAAPTEITNIGSTWEDGEEITLPDDCHLSEWLILTTTHWRIDDWNDLLEGRILQGASTAHNGYTMEAEDNQEEWMIPMMTVISYPTAGETVKIQFQSDVASTNDIEWQAIFAIRLDLFEDYAWVRNTSGVAITAADTDFVAATLTHTTNHKRGMNRRWIFFANSIITYTQDALRTRSFLYQNSVRFTEGENETQVNCGSADEMPIIMIGEIPMDDATDLDIEMVLQEDVTANQSSADDTLIVGFTPELKQPHWAVRRIADWQATPKIYSADRDLPEAAPIDSPTTGPTGNVTIPSGVNRLFVFTFGGTESAGLLTVSTFTVGGIAPTGSLLATRDNGTPFSHTYIYWWDEAAIRSMSGLAISWTDDRTWTSGEFQHDWATYENVLQSDPVPRTDSSSSGGVTELTLTGLTIVNTIDMVVAMGCGDLEVRAFVDCDGLIRVNHSTQSGIASRTGVFEGNTILGSGAILCKFNNNTNDAVVAGIVIQSAGRFDPHYVQSRNNTLLRM